MKNNKSIEELENDYWSDSDFDSYVVKTVHNARKKPVIMLSNEEIRLLIGQRVGLKYILPLAVSILEKDPLAKTNFYEGDLLNQLLNLPICEWENNNTELKKFRDIISNNLDLISSCNEISRETVYRYLSD